MLVCGLRSMDWIRVSLPKATNLIGSGEYRIEMGHRASSWLEQSQSGYSACSQAPSSVASWQVFRRHRSLSCARARGARRSLRCYEGWDNCWPSHRTLWHGQGDGRTRATLKLSSNFNLIWRRCVRQFHVGCHLPISMHRAFLDFDASSFSVPRATPFAQVMTHHCCSAYAGVASAAAMVIVASRMVSLIICRSQYTVRHVDDRSARSAASPPSSLLPQ
jgi:hypothetical protein